MSYFKRNLALAKNSLLELQPKTVPQLFLYSKADQLIPSTDVEYYIKSYKDAGFRVESVSTCINTAFAISLIYFSALL